MFIDTNRREMMTISIAWKFIVLTWLKRRALWILPRNALRGTSLSELRIGTFNLTEINYKAIDIRGKICVLSCPYFSFYCVVGNIEEVR